MLKRAFDIAFALCGLILLSPGLILLAIWIKWQYGDGVLYKGVRVGRFGVPFRIYKFRSMVVNAENLGGPSTADDDPRVTKLGRFLRKYKLDDLPQLINVLKGDMSVVGPRPEVPMYVALFTEEEKLILGIRPGITDWASIWDSNEEAVLAGSPDPERVYVEKIRPGKVRLQLEYLRRRSFWIDVKIILQTLAVIVFRTQPHVPLELNSRREGLRWRSNLTETE